MSVSGSWTPHFDQRIAKATNAYYGLLNAGLLGGAHPPKLCADVAKAAILPVLDSCKSATCYFFMRGNKGNVTKVQSLILKIAKTILGTSSRASSSGVLAELGWAPEPVRADRQMTLLFQSFCSAPIGSLPYNYIKAALPAENSDRKDMSPFIKRSLGILSQMEMDPTLIKTKQARKIIKNFFDKKQQQSSTRRIPA